MRKLEKKRSQNLELERRRFNKLDTLKKVKFSYMNNSKYRRFFSLCDKYNLQSANAKSLLNDNLSTILLEEYDKVEGYTPDYLSGPIKFSEIEFILIDIKNINIEQFEIDLQNLGKFHYKIDKDTFILYGYSDN